MRDGIKEILESGQFPGVSIRTPVRSAVMRDAAGRSTRVVYGSQEDTGSVERDMMGLAEQDGLDLGSARMDVTEEHGQGIGKRHNHTLKNLPPVPKRSKGMKIPDPT